MSMSLKAIIATIILGTSSFAAADTLRHDDHDVDVRDHRTEQPQPAPATQYAPPPVYTMTPATTVQVQAQDRVHGMWRRPVAQPITLASSLRINGRGIIRVNEQTRAFSKLELQSVSGRTNLDKVMIQFANGQTQTIDCDRTLNGNESFSIDLQGNQRNIKRIVLVGKAGRRAAVNVLAV